MQFKAIKTLSSFISGGENRMTSFASYLNLPADVSKISEKHVMLQQTWNFYQKNEIFKRQQCKVIYHKYVTRLFLTPQSSNIFKVVSLTQIGLTHPLTLTSLTLG